MYWKKKPVTIQYKHCPYERNIYSHKATTKVIITNDLHAQHNTYTNTNVTANDPFVRALLLITHNGDFIAALNQNGKETDTYRTKDENRQDIPLARPLDDRLSWPVLLADLRRDGVSSSSKLALSRVWKTALGFLHLSL